jgi:hypothetical protein
VNHARYYIDRDVGGEQKMREIDVVAEVEPAEGATDAPSAMLYIAVECKTTNRGPWALFLDAPPSRTEANFLGHFPYYAYRAVVDSACEAATPGSILAPVQRPAYQVVDTGKPDLDRKQKSDQDRNTAWDAVRQVLDAAAALRFEHRARLAGKTPGVGLIVPVIVTAAPLVAVWLDQTGDVEVEEVERMPLLAGTRQVATDMRGRPAVARLSRSALWVVHEDDVDQFAADSVRAGRSLRAAPPPLGPGGVAVEDLRS